MWSELVKTFLIPRDASPAATALRQAKHRSKQCQDEYPTDRIKTQYRTDYDHRSKANPSLPKIS